MKTIKQAEAALRLAQAKHIIAAHELCEARKLQLQQALAAAQRPDFYFISTDYRKAPDLLFVPAQNVRRVANNPKFFAVDFKGQTHIVQCGCVYPCKHGCNAAMSLRQINIMQAQFAH